MVVWRSSIRIAVVLMLTLALACGKSSSGEGEPCVSSIECSRGELCLDQRCTVLECTSHGDCASSGVAGSVCWQEQGSCTPVECTLGLPCPPGMECMEFLCQPEEPECEGNYDCAQPAEKCVDGKCIPRSYCEDDSYCHNGYCNLEESVCISYPPDVPDIVDEFQGCEEVEAPMLSYLCLSCDLEDPCSCNPGVCHETEGGGYCSAECSLNGHCPSGYKCKEERCQPIGVGCTSCVLPDSACPENMACDFSSGQCIPAIAVCLACSLDYECGVGYRCASKDGSSKQCMPECSQNYVCPAGSSCQEREDGAMVCMSVGLECCYGEGCDQCGCEPPLSVCHEGHCVECLTNTDCPYNKPYCKPDEFECQLLCLEPNPVYWEDPDTGEGYCVQCVNSAQDCPIGQYCGMDENNPETYHTCFTP